VRAPAVAPPDLDGGPSSIPDTQGL
jgi:hypothetical protein